MTAVAPAIRVSAAPARSPRPKPAPARLRVAAPARRISRLGVLAAVVTVGVLVVAVLFHVMLAEGQLRLDGLGHHVAVEQRVYEERRLQVATLSAPQRIVDAARRLGLTLPPDPPVYLEVQGAQVSHAGATQTPSTIAQWKKVKASLGDS